MRYACYIFWIDVVDLIQNLPSELQEMILKEYIANRHKNEAASWGTGWDTAHEELEDAAFCEERTQRCYFAGNALLVVTLPVT